MNKKAKIAVLGVILSLVIAAIIILPFMSTAQAEVSYNNNLLFTPSEIQGKAPLTAEKDDNWQVEWHEAYAGLTHREYVVAIQNQKDTSSDFALSVIFDSLNFDASQVSNINIQESRLVSKDIPVYEIIENCEYPSTVDNETEKVIGNSTICSITKQLKGYDTIQAYEWVKVKDTSSEIATSAVKQEAYDPIPFDGKSGKEENNIRYFKLGFDVPIVKLSDGSWGSEGRVAFIEKNSGKEYHPMWKQSYTYYRNMTINSSVTSAIKNLTIPINSSAGWRENIGWTTIDVFPCINGQNCSTIFYYNDETNTTMVNYSDNKEFPIEWERGASSNNSFGSMWSSESEGVYHATSWGMDSSGNNNHLINSSVNSGSGITINSTGKIGSAWNFSGALGENFSTSTDVFNPTSQLTISMWIYASSLTAPFDEIQPILLDKPIEIGENGVNIQIGKHVQYSFDNFNCRFNNVDTKSTSLFSDYVRKWVYLTCRFNGTGITTYINGAPEKSSTLAGNIIESGVNWTFGTDGVNGRQFSGMMDEIRIEMRALSDNEIRFNYEAQKGGYIAFASEDETKNADEAYGDEAIQQGILNSSISSSSPVIISDGQVYVVNLSSTFNQSLGKFDVVVVNGTQTWAFNYVTQNDPTSNFTHMVNMPEALYVLEMANITYTQIRQQVTNFIEATKI